MCLEHIVNKMNGQTVSHTNKRNSVLEFLDKLKCFKCNKYLSFFPIYSDENLNSICGRCGASTTQNWLRNSIFETCMETFSFPCCHDSYGCTGKFIPKDIPDHEHFCEHKMIECPVFDHGTNTICEWRGHSVNIYDHFEEKHPKYILRDGKFEADLITNYSGNFLFAFGQEYFICTKTTDSSRKIATCILTYIGNDPHVNDYYYKITLKTTNGKNPVDIVNQMGTAIEMSIPEIINLLGNPSSILAEINVFEKPVADDDREDNVETHDTTPSFLPSILETIRCSSCSKYPLPPIYECKNGHCVCRNCWKDVNRCSKCRKELSSVQNFALARVIRHLIYPCSHPDCNLTSRPVDIRKHEANCPHRQIYCPVKETTFCEFKSSLLKINDHLLSDHSRLLNVTEEISCHFEDDMISSHYLIPYDNIIFILHFNADLLNDSVKWSVQFNSTKEDNKNYQFDIDIQDLSGENRRLFFRGNCSPIKHEKMESQTEVFMRFDQIKTYVRDDERLFYNLRIIEEN